MTQPGTSGPKTRRCELALSALKWKVAPEFPLRIRDADAVRKAERGMKLFLPHDKGEPFTTGYVAQAIWDEAGKPTGVFKVGKPRRDAEAGDYTEEGGGPYEVNTVSMTCTCPANKPNEKGRRQHCKHIFGLV